MIDKHSIADRKIINQIIELYNSGNYVTTINMVSNYFRFDNKNEIEEYLKHNKSIDENQSSKLSIILQEWLNWKNLLIIDKIYAKDTSNFDIYKPYFKTPQELVEALESKIINSVLSKEQLERLKKFSNVMIEQIPNQDILVKIIDEYENTGSYIKVLNIVNNNFTDYVQLKSVIYNTIKISEQDREILRDISYIYKYIDKSDIAGTVFIAILKVVLNMYEYLDEKVVFKYLQEKYKYFPNLLDNLNIDKYQDKYFSLNDLEKLKDISYKFKTEYLSNQEKMDEELNSKYNYSHRIYNLLDLLELENLPDMQIIDMIFNVYKYKLTFLNSCFNSEKNFLKQKSIDKIEGIFDMYSKNPTILLKKPVDIDQQLSLARTLINDFINSKDTIVHYCNKNNINSWDFKNLINLLKLYDKELYDKYKQYQANDKVIIDMKSIYECQKVLEQLKNNKKFDILDYFNITKLTLKECLKIINTINDQNKKEDIALFRNFCNKNILNHELNDKEIEILYDMKHTFLIKDSNGTTKEVSATMQDKKNVIRYLKNNDIPIYSKVYSIALKKYLSHELIIDEHYRRK